MGEHSDSRLSGRLRQGSSRTSRRSTLGGRCGQRRVAQSGLVRRALVVLTGRRYTPESLQKGRRVHADGADLRWGVLGTRPSRSCAKAAWSLLGSRGLPSGLDALRALAHSCKSGERSRSELKCRAKEEKRAHCRLRAARSFVCTQLQALDVWAHWEQIGSRPSHFIFFRRQHSQARQTRRRCSGRRMGKSERSAMGGG